MKTNHSPLPSNKELTKVRILDITKRLERMGKIEQYHHVMANQINTGILKPIPDKPSGNQVHYIPHHADLNENAETTKVRIVYDCSSKESNNVPSLNDSLETGASLQPKLFDILIRNHLKRLVITGDAQKAFLQIRTDKRDQDVQHILWYNNLEDKLIKEFRCSRVIFGASSSPYILGATTERHLE